MTRIRPAALADCPRLPDIERAASRRFVEAGLAPALVAEVTPIETLVHAVADGRLWVAVGDDDLPVGFALADWLDGEPYLDEVDVLPEMGRRGIGAALVGAVVAWARESGHPRLVLVTFVDLPWNAPFYARLGFRSVPPAEMGPAIREVLQDESRRGFPADRRVVMALALAE